MDTTREVDRILADAAEKAGLDDFGDTWFLGPLSAYAASVPTTSASTSPSKTAAAAASS